MRINGCEIKDIYANYDEEIGGYGDIYNTIEDCKKEHPGAKILHGYYVVPPYGYNGDTPDWFDTYEEAFTYAVTEV